MAELKVLTVNSITEIDMGCVAEAVQRGLSRAAADCVDRPLEGKARTVSVKFIVVPDPDQSGACEKIKVGIEVDDDIPKRRTRVISMYARKTRREGRIETQLLFDADSPENVDQTTLLNEE